MNYTDLPDYSQTRGAPAVRAPSSAPLSAKLTHRHRPARASPVGREIGATLGLGGKLAMKIGIQVGQVVAGGDDLQRQWLEQLEHFRACRAAGFDFVSW